jgi:hypothetical protein
MTSLFFVDVACHDGDAGVGAMHTLTAVPGRGWFPAFARAVCHRTRFTRTIEAPSMNIL